VVVVVDNGCRDESAEIARRPGARVIHEPVAYGSASMAGIEAARAPSVVMADVDDSYGVGDLERVSAELRDATPAWYRPGAMAAERPGSARCIAAGNQPST
jgi:glycosyltransferase involved in cell wall biosynthesis